MSHGKEDVGYAARWTRAGDVAGGAPKKYVSGCWVEGSIAAKTCLAEINFKKAEQINESAFKDEIERIYKPFYLYKNKKDGIFPREMETKLQKLINILTD